MDAKDRIYFLDKIRNLFEPEGLDVSITNADFMAYVKIIKQEEETYALMSVDFSDNDYLVLNYDVFVSNKAMYYGSVFMDEFNNVLKTVFGFLTDQPFSKLLSWIAKEETQDLIKIFGEERTTAETLGFSSHEKALSEFDDPFLDGTKNTVGFIKLSSLETLKTSLTKKDFHKNDFNIATYNLKTYENKLLQQVNNSVKIPNPYTGKHFTNIEFYYSPKEHGIFIIPKHNKNIPYNSFLNWVDNNDTKARFSSNLETFVLSDNIGIHNMNMLGYALHQFYKKNVSYFYLNCEISLPSLPYFREIREEDFASALSREYKISLEPKTFNCSKHKIPAEEIINNFTKRFPSLQFFFVTFKDENQWFRGIHIHANPEETY